MFQQIITIYLLSLSKAPMQQSMFICFFFRKLLLYFQIIISEIGEDESESSKDNKLDNESFRPPSRLKPDFNISIKSELMNGLKKDDLSGTSKGGSANSSSNMCKKFNLNCAQNKQNKGLNPKTDSYYEEELYFKGCTAVWSKGMYLSLNT